MIRLKPQYILYVSFMLLLFILSILVLCSVMTQENKKDKFPYTLLLKKPRLSKNVKTKLIEYEKRKVSNE